MIPENEPLKKLSVVIPAKDEQQSIEAMAVHLHGTLLANRIPHEIVVVDDGSSDATWERILRLGDRFPGVIPLRNSPPFGFGCAIRHGLGAVTGDAVVIMMADESDACHDVIRYWQTLNAGFDCVFGSRFIKGGSTAGYPPLKYLLNRLANRFIQFLFNIRLNDTTNAFKACRTSVIKGCSPLLSHHFNLTVELPLKAIVRGYTWTVVPISWRNRQTGSAKFRIKEMGSRYFFIIMYVWLEKYFSRGDYRKQGF